MAHYVRGTLSVNPSPPYFLWMSDDMTYGIDVQRGSLTGWPYPLVRAWVTHAACMPHWGKLAATSDATVTMHSHCYIKHARYLQTNGQNNK